MKALTDVVNLLSNFEILDQSVQPFFIKDSKGVYCYCNETFVKQLGISKNRILGATAFDLFPIANARVYTESDRELFATEERKQQYVGPIALAHSKANAVTFQKNIIFDHLGSAVGFLGTFVLDSPASPASPVKASSPIDVLTKKEATVLNYVAQGFSNKVIAHKLSISEHTIASHMKAIFSKLDVHSKTEAVYKALIQIKTVNA
jgi:DNA-binding CsgD family transcriptional regulator